MNHRAAIPFVALVLVAGCLDGASPEDTAEPTGPGAESAFAPFTVPEPDFDFSTVVTPDHGAHSVPDLHTVGHGLGLKGHTGVGEILPAGVRGSITQIDVWDGYAVVAGFEGGPAFIIVDLTDPSNPRPVGYAPTVAYGWSAQFSHDGKFVFYGCQTVGPPYPPQGALRGTCEDPEAVHGEPGSTTPGVSVWDVSDKTDPQFIDWVPTAGTHNLQAGFINGYDYVFTNAVDIVRFDRATGTLEVVGNVPGRHDATVAKHPVTGDWLLYSGVEDLVIYNVNVPEDFEVVFEQGAWGNRSVGWHDQVPFPALVDGRALLALAGETGTSEAAGAPDKVSIVDITDPYDPQLLGIWEAPFANAMIPWNSYTFSVHEMAATPQGQLAVAWYHGGVWVLDVSTQERQVNPVTVAAYQPHEAINVLPSTFQQTPVPMVPFVWSAGWDERGYLIIPDMHTGVYVLEPDWGLLPLIDSGA